MFLSTSDFEILLACVPRCWRLHMFLHKWINIILRQQSKRWQCVTFASIKNMWSKHLSESRRKSQKDGCETRTSLFSCSGTSKTKWRQFSVEMIFASDSSSIIARLAGNIASKSTTIEPIIQQNKSPSLMLLLWSNFPCSEYDKTVVYIWSSSLSGFMGELPASSRRERRSLASYPLSRMKRHTVAA